VIVVTGAAGFIGSNVVRALNAAGRSDVVAVDWLGSEGKWRNLQGTRISALVRPERLLALLDAATERVDAIVHLGAVSSTTATDGDHVMATNFALPCDILDRCCDEDIPFVYASSAATYGDGTKGFVDYDDIEFLTSLRPLNLYGFSKNMFDIEIAERLAEGDRLPGLCVGFKFFNVFGPGEDFKGDMASVLSKKMTDVAAGRPVQLFRSHQEGFEDGGQLRDFVYVRDVVDVILWTLAGALKNGETSLESGIYNLGTGKARSFRDMIEAAYAAFGHPSRIEYVDMPESIRGAYQYYTQAEMGKLRRAGYDLPFRSIEEAVADYVELVKAGMA
jgi:ADP-L-glycero-D-manno-heptose 6-epimerase